MTETATAPAAEPSTAPNRAPLVLLALILVAAVANLNLAVANVALPDIGKAFDASQTELDLVAVGYSLGLAASVLWLGALGDRYGRKMMLILGVLLSIPACIVAAWAGSIEVLIGARIVGGISAGMAYPTTLALIAALWSGPAGRSRSRCGPPSAVRSLRSDRSSPGALLQHFWWGSVFLVTLPLAVGRAGARRLVRAEPCERDHRTGRQPRRRALCAHGRWVDPGHQLRSGAEREQGGLGALGRGDRGRDRLLHQAEARAPFRCTTSTSRRAASSGSRRARASSCSAR